MTTAFDADDPDEDAEPELALDEEPTEVPPAFGITGGTTSLTSLHTVVEVVVGTEAEAVAEVLEML
jgi:hypothetical protein